MEASSLDMESQKIKLLYETICKEIDDKVARSEEANKLLKKIQDRDIAKDTAWNDLGNTLRKGV